MKKTSRSKRTLVIVSLVIVALVAVGAFASKQWLIQNYYRQKVEKTLSTQLKPLASTLKSLGFGDLTTLDTACSYNIYPDTSAVTDAAYSAGKVFECSSSVRGFIKVPTDEQGKATFNQNAFELSKILQANGWESRKEYPTVSWFEKISQGVDYQPDQLNLKTVGNIQCTIDFFTAFSQPDPAALSLHAYCSKLQTDR